MTHDEVVEIVKKALELEKDVTLSQSEYATLSKQCYPALSVNPPVKGKVETEKYPTVESSVKANYVLLIVVPLILCFGGLFSFTLLLCAAPQFDGIIGVIGIIGVFLSIAIALAGIALFIVYFCMYTSNRKADIEQKKQTDAYKTQCMLVDSRNAKLLEVFEEEYKAKVFEYENEIVPQYNADKAEWEKQHNAEVSEAKNKLENLQKELSEHYELTKIIPSKYHDIVSLEYIYEILSTSSEYDFKEAAADLERERQNNIELQRVYALQEQNALLDEQNAIADRARRDANMQALVGAVQNHNRNKSLSSISKSLK